MLRPCHFCGHPLEETWRVCTQCGRAYRTPKQVRTLGWVLVGLGMFLVIFMAGVSYVVGRIILKADPESTTRYTGDATGAIVIFSILGAVMLFGMVGLAAGVSQVRTGRINRRMVAVVVAFGVALFVGAQLSLILL